MTISSPQIVVAVGGPKGSGKSTVLQQVLSTLPQFKHLSFGNWLTEESQRKLHTDFPDLDKQNKTLLRKRFERKIMQLKKSHQIIIDMHFGEFEEGGYPCVVPTILLQNFTHILLLTASAEAIYQRRIQDHKKRRVDPVSIQLNILGEQLHYNSLCDSSHAKHAIFLNNDSNRTAKKLAQFLSN